MLNLSPENPPFCNEPLDSGCRYQQSKLARAASKERANESLSQHDSCLRPSLPSPMRYAYCILSTKVQHSKLTSPGGAWRVLHALDSQVGPEFERRGVFEGVSEDARADGLAPEERVFLHRQSSPLAPPPIPPSMCATWYSSKPQYFPRGTGKRVMQQDRRYWLWFEIY